MVPTIGPTKNKKNKSVDGSRDLVLRTISNTKIKDIINSKIEYPYKGAENSISNNLPSTLI
jgi:hypothetical protein